MYFSMPIQWYHSHVDPIWPDGTFKKSRHLGFGVFIDIWTKGCTYLLAQDQASTAARSTASADITPTAISTSFSACLMSILPTSHMCKYISHAWSKNTLFSLYPFLSFFMSYVCFFLSSFRPSLLPVLSLYSQSLCTYLPSFHPRFHRVLHLSHPCLSLPIPPSFSF